MLLDKSKISSFVSYFKCWAALIALSSSAFANAIDCKEEYQKHIASDLSLSYEEFDQTSGQGMRTLASTGCAKETADLILAYIEKTGSSHGSLIWHVAQQRALQGAYGDAIIYARKSLKDKEDFSKNALRWNDYVQATIAFLEKDKEKFVFHSKQVAMAKDIFFGNSINYKLLEKLERNFYKSYKDASETKEPL